MENSGSARKVVIVVEDDQAVGSLIAGALSDEPGYCAIHVVNPAAALETAKHVSPDVIIVDVGLPGMTGFELYDRLKSDPRTSDVPVLFETGTGDESLAEFRRRGIATYVKKPFDLNEVVEYVKKLADGSPASATTPPGSALPRHA